MDMAEAGLAPRPMWIPNCCGNSIELAARLLSTYCIPGSIKSIKLEGNGSLLSSKAGFVGGQYMCSCRWKLAV